MKTENPSARATVNRKLCKPAIALYQLYSREIITEVQKNPITRIRTRYFHHAYPPTHDILVSEVGGSDRIGFISSYDRKIRDNTYVSANP
jgi:hypothetical protein